MTITITTICLNPCFDRTVEVDSLQINRVNRIRSARDDLGGKGINVAVVAKRLGLDVQCLGLMGKEGSVELGEMMDRERLTHHFLPVPGRVRTNMKIYSRDGQGVTELNEPGAAVNVEILEKFTQMACENTKNRRNGQFARSVHSGLSVYKIRRSDHQLVFVHSTPDQVLFDARQVVFLDFPRLA